MFWHVPRTAQVDLAGKPHRPRFHLWLSTLKTAHGLAWLFPRDSRKWLAVVSDHDGEVSTSFVSIVEAARQGTRITRNGNEEIRYATMAINSRFTLSLREFTPIMGAC